MKLRFQFADVSALFVSTQNTYTVGMLLFMLTRIPGIMIDIVILSRNSLETIPGRVESF